MTLQHDQELSQATSSKLVALKTILKELHTVLVAYSGGVDSAFLLKAAVDELGDRVLAVTADSQTIPRAELQAATQLARSLGARHLIVNTNELSDPQFATNPPDRCYHCKKTLFATLTKIARERQIEYVIEGSNLSDLGDYRPGTKAVDQFQVRSPLKEAGLTKDEIRLLSRDAGLPTWDKPAAPCLSSRIPYGSEITVERLRRIEAAEAFLHELGFKILRVRDHGTVGRIEVPKEDLPRLLSDDVSERVGEKLKTLGFQFVAVDLRGFRSGSLNEALDGKPDGQK